MKRTNLLIGATLMLASLASAAAQPDAAKKLPADDNVQAQTQAKVKQPKPTMHYKKRNHHRDVGQHSPAQ